MACDLTMTAGFSSVCGYKPKQGILEKYYINLDDIDKAATILANSNNLITTLVLKAGKKIYQAEGNDKSHIAKASGVIGDYGNGVLHTDTLNIITRKIAEREQVQKIIDGARVVTLIKKVDGSDDGSTTYEILGFESGMKMSTYEWDSSANSGVATLEVASVEGEEEATPPKVFLDTDLTTTETWITTNLYVAP